MTTQTNLDLIWASTGGTTDPGDTKYATGWVSEIPTYQNFNFVLQNNAKNNLVLAEDGFFTWQNNIAYKAGTYTILSGKRYYCRVDNTNQNPSTDTLGNYWIQGDLVGNALPAVAIMDKGALTKSPAPSTAGSWNSNTHTLEHAQPTIALVGDNAAHKNWLIANVAGEPVLVDVGTTTAPDNRNIAIGQAGTKKIYHEGNKPVQADVSGTIPDANTDGILYGRKDGAWASITAALGADATTTSKGVVELATSAETITGTDAIRAVTPAGLAAKVSSTTQSGIIKVATQGTVDLGTNNDQAVTSLTLENWDKNPEATLAAQGQWKDNHTGLITVWGTFESTGDANQAIVFDTPFPSYCIGVFYAGTGDANNTAFGMTANTITTSGFNANRDDAIDGTTTMRYIAMGY